jgi:TolB protein
MIYYLMRFFILTISISLCAQDRPAKIAITAAHHEKMKIAFFIRSDNERLQEISNLIRQMLERSKASKSGFAIMLEKGAQLPAKAELKKWYQKGVPLAVLFSSHDPKALEWRLYDTSSGMMVKGKRCALALYGTRTVAEHVADELWPLLTGQPGFFSTRIAYCKLVKQGKRMVKHIYVTAPYFDIVHSDGQARLLVGHTNAFAPRWNHDKQDPMVLYCQIGACNVRLMAVSFDNRTKLVANLDGMTTCPSFSPDGKTVVYCAANGTIGSNAHIYLYSTDGDGEPFLQQITTNDGNNVSPTLCPTGDIVFCSDFEGKQPAIYCYRAASQTMERITADGYCTAPAYCAANHCISYSRLCGGINQLWMYDPVGKKHQQLTFDAGDKKESSWSPCGNYLVFAHDTGVHSRIAVHHMMSNERIYLTAKDELCSYPNWSPVYQKPIPI